MNHSPVIVIYDDQCPFCRSQISRLKRWDTGGKLRFEPGSADATLDLHPNLTAEALRESIHCVTPDGRLDRGARCLRTISSQIPILNPLSFGLRIPGVLALAEIVYGWISRNRYRLGRCPDSLGCCSSSERDAR